MMGQALNLFDFKINTTKINTTEHNKYDGT